MKGTKIYVGLAMAALSSFSVAGDAVFEGYYLAPSLSYNLFDYDRDLEDDLGFGIGFGYQYDQNWAVEVAYHASEADVESNDSTADAEYWHLDALYHLDVPSTTNTSHYIVFGAGERSYDETNLDDSVTELNVGVGVMKGFSERLYFRGDVRGLFDVDEIDTGAMVNLGIVYYFGDSSSSVAKSTTRPVASEPAEDATAAQPADGDSDGVADAQDQCPDTSAGAKVDEVGCYEVLSEEVSFTLDVKFKTASSELDQSSVDSIKELAVFLTEYPQTEVVIEGHSDSQGQAAYNKQLSQDRAEAVMQYLITELNVDAERISAVGYGEEQPIADNSTAEGRAQNRRVVAKVKAMKTSSAE